MVRIITNETPVEELKRRFHEELTGQMKDAALKLNCPVEELKYRVNNAGIVQIERMDANEMVEMQAKDVQDSKIRAIKKSRGVFDV
jgi:hypothetical protein